MLPLLLLTHPTIAITFIVVATVIFVILVKVIASHASYRVYYFTSLPTAKPNPTKTNQNQHAFYPTYRAQPNKQQKSYTSSS